MRRSMHRAPRLRAYRRPASNCAREYGPTPMTTPFPLSAAPYSHRPRLRRVTVAAAARCAMRATSAAGSAVQGSGVTAEVVPAVTAGCPCPADDPHPAAITITAARTPMNRTDAVGLRDWHEMSIDPSSAIIKCLPGLKRPGFDTRLVLSRLSRLCGCFLPGQADGVNFFAGYLVRTRCAKFRGDQYAAELAEHVGGRRLGLAAVPGSGSTVAVHIGGVVSGGGVPAVIWGLQDQQSRSRR